MTITPTRVTCLECAHVCDVELVTDAPVAVAVASMKAARCPRCGGKKLGMGGEIAEGKPSLDCTGMDERARWWWSRGGDRGLSSETIWRVMRGWNLGEGRGGVLLGYPHDPDDFSRCRKLLDLIPEWRARIAMVAERLPWFRPFTDRWDEMDRLWDEESPGGACPKLYALMEIAGKEADEIRSKA